MDQTDPTNNAGNPVKKVLQVHNRYVWSPGGEIAVLELEAELMSERGVEIDQFFIDNADEDVSGLSGKIKTAKNCVWNKEARKQVRAKIEESKPDVVHVHNTFVHLSPSVFAACQDAGVPVVQTIHNFRMMCAQAALLRDHKVCQDCVGQFPWPALKHKCYRGSLAATLPLVAMQRVNRANGTFFKKVNKFIMLSDFMKELYIKDGFPQDILMVKEHSVKDPQMPIDRPRENKFVYVGRLVEEKGPDVLIDAWLKANLEGWELHVLGEGDMKEALQAQAEKAGCKSIVWHGWADRETVMEHINTAKFLINSSVCYESFGLTVVEALACGTPSVVPGHGAMPFIGDIPHVGLSFVPGDTDDLAKVLHKIQEMEESDWQRRSREARARYEARYTHDVNFNNLMAVYGAARS